MARLYALISLTPLAPPSQLFLAARALEINAFHCAKAWDREPPGVMLMGRKEAVPRDVSPIVLLEQSKEDQGALAVHFWDHVRNAPAAQGYPDRASGFNFGRSSVLEAVSHEIVEAEINPRVNVWVPHPVASRRADGVYVALEVADPTQLHYEVEAHGVPCRVSNFVHPAWFGMPNPPGVEGFDHLGELKSPGAIGSEGYVVLRQKIEGRWVVWYEDAFGKRFGSAPERPLALVRSGRTLDAENGVVLEQAA